MAATLTLMGPILPAPAGAELDARATEVSFVASINAFRASRGLHGLAVDDGLTDVARRWAGVMTDAGRATHNPNLATEVSSYLKLAENVGSGIVPSGSLVDQMFAAFVASPTHYVNLVDPDFTHLGVGAVVGSTGVLFTSHVFMKQRGSPAAAPGPTATAPPTTTAPPKTAAPAASAPPPARSPRTRPAPARVQTPPPATEPVADVEPEPAPPPPAPPPSPAPARPVPRAVMVLDLLRVLDGVG